LAHRVVLLRHGFVGCRGQNGFTDGTTGKSGRFQVFRLSSPFCKNISVFPKSKSAYMIGRPTPTRGALAIVIDAGRDAVDAGSARAHDWTAGRVSRERSICAQTNGAAADGKIVWS
jgi:hypothetical protein